MHTHAKDESLVGSHSAALRTRSEFRLSIQAAYQHAAPLFGALREKVWAGDSWNPCFLYPNPPMDIEGAVFTAVGHSGPATWINTAFDLEKGHVQYVYFVAHSMVTLIDIALSSAGPSLTTVRVVYERTALTPEMNQTVQALYNHDNEIGPHWEESINAYFAKQH